MPVIEGIPKVLRELHLMMDETCRVKFFGQQPATTPPLPPCRTMAIHTHNVHVRMDIVSVAECGAICPLLGVSHPF